MTLEYLHSRYLHRIAMLLRVCLASCIVLTALSSCSNFHSTGVSQPLTNLESRVALLSLTGDYGRISTPFIDDYLEYLRSRLSSTLNGNQTFSLILLDTHTPLALSSSSGLTAFSKGLVLSLHSEAELAFVLAHELAHHDLSHFDRSIGEHSPSARQKMEFEADSHALRIMSSAGYNPESAREVLTRTRGFYEDSQFYPAVEERIENIRLQLTQSPPRVSGTVDRRDFQKLRHILREM